MHKGVQKSRFWYVVGPQDDADISLFWLIPCVGSAFVLEHKDIWLVWACFKQVI